MDDSINVDYCGDVTTLVRGSSLTIGREADLSVDDNPFLHRRFLVIAEQEGLWMIANVGSQLSATVSDQQGQLEAFLAPGATLPLVFSTTRVAFTAGPTMYEFIVRNPGASFRLPTLADSDSGDTTIGPTRLTRDQRLMIVALAESRLRVDGRASVTLPTTSQAAKRLGWTTTKFSRKLDNVCDKLTKLGVRGLRGDQADYASSRRARLVEYAVATRLVTAADLDELDHATPD